MAENHYAERGNSTEFNCGGTAEQGKGEDIRGSDKEWQSQAESGRAMDWM